MYVVLLQRHNSKIFAPEFPFWPPFCITRHPFFYIIFYNKANCSLSFFPQHKERIRGESSEQEKKKLSSILSFEKSRNRILWCAMNVNDKCTYLFNFFHQELLDYISWHKILYMDWIFVWQEACNVTQGDDRSQIGIGFRPI